MTVEVVDPEDYMGDVIGDLNSRRGKILGMSQRGNDTQVIDSEVPLADDVRLRDRPSQQDAGPRRRTRMQFSHYEAVPDARSRTRSSRRFTGTEVTRANPRAIEG